MNLPFFHITRLDEGDLTTGGGLKMAIRMLKNIKADSSRSIDLSSYDTAGAMWNCDPALLRFRTGHELSVLLGTDQWLEMLVNHPGYASGLTTPDGIRTVFDKPSKLAALAVLASEVAALRSAVAEEWLPLLKSRSFAADARRSLEQVAIPG